MLGLPNPPISVQKNLRWQSRLAVGRVLVMMRELDESNRPQAANDNTVAAGRRIIMIGLVVKAGSMRSIDSILMRTKEDYDQITMKEKRTSTSDKTDDVIITSLTITIR